MLSPRRDSVPSEGNVGKNGQWEGGDAGGSVLLLETRSGGEMSVLSPAPSRAAGGQDPWLGCWKDGRTELAFRAAPVSTHCTSGNPGHVLEMEEFCECGDQGRGVNRANNWEE